MELKECFLRRISSRFTVEGRDAERLNQAGIVFTKEEVEALLSLM